MDMPWHDEVACYDASPWGWGACSARWPPGLVQATGRQRERFRFRGPLASTRAPRDDPLEKDIRGLSHADICELGKTASFQEIPEEGMQHEEWMVAGVFRWRERE
eukprot:2849701-Lingulodinium_polyedra.AAC.1